MRIHLLHGFNTSDKGAGTTDTLVYPLSQAGYEVNEIDYGWVGLIGTYFRNKSVAKRLNREAQPGDIAIGHSNGAAIIHMATHLEGCPLMGVIYINPALDQRFVPGPSVKHWTVFYSPSDGAVPWARFLPLNIWGDMGRSGYKPDKGEAVDPRCRNINLEQALGVKNVEHSDCFYLPGFTELLVDEVSRASNLVGGAA